jgi:hypothetical protein
VGSLQKLDIGSPRCQNLGGMRVDDHARGDRGVTSADQRSRPFHFHNTNTANTRRTKIGAVTEGWDFNAYLLSGLQNCYFLMAACLLAIYHYLYLCHEFTSTLILI